MMKRRCELCGILRNETEFVGYMCGWCEKLRAEIEADRLGSGI